MKCFMASRNGQLQRRNLVHIQGYLVKTNICLQYTHLYQTLDYVHIQTLFLYSQGVEI